MKLIRKLSLTTLIFLLLASVTFAEMGLGLGLGMGGSIKTAPPLYISGASTWPITDGLVGVGAGFTMLDAGTWSTAGGYVLNTPNLQAEQNSGALVVGKWYSITATAANHFYTGSAIGDTFRALATTALDANNKVKLIPISNLIANCQLSTTEVLSEEVIHAGTLKTQIGQVGNLDCSFAAKAATLASTGQAVISLKEVTGRQFTDFAPHNMTTNNAPSPFVASASTTVGINDAYSAFDGNIPAWPYWLGSNSGVDWLKLDLGSGFSKKLLSYSIQVNAIPEPDRAPKNWTMEGSNDNSTWDALDTRTNQTSWTSGQIRNFVCATYTTQYRYFRLNITANNGDATYTQVGEIYLYAYSGLSTSDTITVGGVTYAIASVTGGANVAYSDSLKTQTVTLGTNLGADVAANAPVGLDWASWNGVVGPYFDGAGNVMLDEVVAGVYTNRINVAVTFAADKVLSLQKVASAYTLKFDGATIGTTSLINAAAMAGKYSGMFSTHIDNKITYLKVP